jgi:hypothetical protein
MRRTIGTKFFPDNDKLVAAFQTHCADYAQQCANGEATRQETLDWLQDWANTRGLLELIGQDAVQQIMAEAFLPKRKEPQS